MNSLYLFNTLTEIPDGKFFNILLRLTNSSRKIKDNKVVSEKFNTLIRTYSDRIKSEKVRKRSKALFEYIDTSEQINKNNSTNAKEILKNWADKRDYFMYASLLCELIENGCSDESVKREVQAIVMRCPDSQYNSYLHLAIEYAQRFLLKNDDTTES